VSIARLINGPGVRWFARLVVGPAGRRRRPPVFEFCSGARRFAWGHSQFVRLDL
jgi:hypothetical protein